jgi:hypothetical protein
MKYHYSNPTIEASMFSLNHTNQTTHGTSISFLKRILIHAQEKISLNSTLLICCLFLLVSQGTVQAANFTSVSNGDWNAASTWNQNRVPDIDNYPNDKVTINHTVTKSGNLTMNGTSTKITINNGGSLVVTGRFLVGSGKLIMASGSSLTGNTIYLNTTTSFNCGLNGTITSTGNMDLDGKFSGSPTIVVGGNLLAGAQNLNQIFTNLNLQVSGNMTVQNANFRWSAGTVSVGGNFVLKGSGDVDVPNTGTLTVSGTLSVNNLLSIDGPNGSGSGGIVSWGVGNVILSGNNKGLNNCPLPYLSPFDLSSCSQVSVADITAPVITSGITGTNLAENSGAGQIVYTTTASDDTGVDSYDIDGTDASLLSVNSSTGVVSLAADPDYETKSSYSFTVTASDAAGNTSAATTVTFSITDVDEIAPEITLLGDNPATVEMDNTYSDAGATATDDTDGNLTDNIVATSNVDVTTAGSYTVTYNVSDAAGNAATAVVRNVTVESSATRTSVAAGNFVDGATWDCNCVPDTDEHVVVNHDVTLNTNYSQDRGREFKVNSGNTLTIQNTYTLALAGEFSNLGTLTGKLKLNGTSAQTPVLGSIESLEIDNASGVTLDTDLDISGALKLSDGVLNLNGNSLTLKSSSSSSGLLENNGGSLSGAITIERYVPEAGSGHHYLSTPMSNSLLAEFEDDFSFNLSGSFPSLYYYSEPTSAWVTPNSAGDAMVLGRGYTGYFSGDVIVDISGTPNSGATNIDLTSDVDGWNFAGNPYPSPIDWDLVTFPYGVSPALYVWDHDPAIWGKYTTYIDGIGINGGTHILPMMQSFFVKAYNSATLTFQDNDRILEHNNDGNFYKSSKTGNDPLIRLQVSGFSFKTETVVRFKPGATADYDPTIDALLFPSPNPLGIDFSSVSSDSKNLVINTLPEQSLENMIQLYLHIGTTGNYNIDRLEFNNFPSTSAVILHDTKLSLTHDLNNGSYSFVGNIVDSDQRFILEIVDLTVGISEEKSKDEMSIFLNNGVVNINFEGTLLANTKLAIYNVLGQSIYTTELNKGNEKYILDHTPLKAGGIYFVRIEGFEEIVKLSFIR